MPTPPPPSSPAESSLSPWLRYAIAAAASLATVGLTFPLLPYLDLANISMLFLLTVVLVSVRFGRRASLVATLVGVAGLTLTERLFALPDLQYAVTVLVMLTVGLITGKLTSNLRYQVWLTSQREARSRALYEFARALSGVLRMEQVFEITRHSVQAAFPVRVTMLLPDANGRLHYAQSSIVADFQAPQLLGLDLARAQAVFDQAETGQDGHDASAMDAGGLLYLPLLAPMRMRGILAVLPDYAKWRDSAEQRKQLETFAALTAIALEQVHYIAVAQDALVRMESERLRNSLLSALSHDLRTPLTSLVGLSESLALSSPPLSAAQLGLAHSLRDEAVRMSHLVANLLDMARIQHHQVKLNLQWQYLEEVVGSALRASRNQVQAHQVQTRLAQDLPLVQFDATLLERVLCNLVENAVKYTPPGSQIVIEGSVDGRFLRVAVVDNGPGVPAGQEEAIFEKFARGEKESNKPGVGLGLSICRAIVDAHGGKIHVQNMPGGGAAFVFSLPLGTPPDLALLDQEPALADMDANDAAAGSLPDASRLSGQASASCNQSPAGLPDDSLPHPIE